MKIFRLIHNDFGKSEVLAKFIKLPTEQQILDTLKENFEKMDKLEIHTTRLTNVQKKLRWSW